MSLQDVIKHVGEKGRGEVVGDSYDHIRKAAAAATEPFRLRLMQYSIFVLPGPESACVTAKSS